MNNDFEIKLPLSFKEPDEETPPTAGAVTVSLDSLIKEREGLEKAIGQMDFKVLRDRFETLNESFRQGEYEIFSWAELENVNNLFKDYQNNLKLLNDIVPKEQEITRQSRLGTFDSDNDSALKKLEVLQISSINKERELLGIQRTYGRFIVAYRLLNRYKNKKITEIKEALREDSQATYDVQAKSSGYTMLRVCLDACLSEANDDLKENPDDLSLLKKAILRYTKKLDPDNLNGRFWEAEEMLSSGIL